MPSESSSVFRVDKFVVPGHALPIFVEQLQRTRLTLDAIPGCRQNLVLTQLVGPGEYNVMTVVEWASPQAIVAAKDLVKKKYAEEGFDPAVFMLALGVRADMGIYSEA